MATTKTDDRACTVSDDFLRLPGLFRRWEFEQVIDGGEEFHITAAGTTEDGTELFVVYCRERPLLPEVSR